MEEEKGVRVSRVTRAKEEEDSWEDFNWIGFMTQQTNG